MEVSFLGIRFALQSGVGEGQGGGDLGIKVLFQKVEFDHPGERSPEWDCCC